MGFKAQFDHGQVIGSCQISGEDEGDTVDTVGTQGLIMKLGSKMKIKYAQWANTVGIKNKYWKCLNSKKFGILG